MRLILSRGELRLKQGRQKKPVGWRFDGADLPLGTARDDGKPSLHGGPFKVGIDFEVAEEFFGHRVFVFAVERLQVGTGAQTNLRDRSGKLRRAVLAVRYGTGNGINDDVLRSGIVFGAVGVGNVQYIAREL